MTLRIEGYAIVSDDGMLADADGIMPDALVIEADQRFLAEELDRAAVIVHGRNSHEKQRQSPQRRRLIASRSVETLGPAECPNAVTWNPAGMSLEQALEALDVEGGTVAILGGTDIFGLFLPRYDSFHLSRATGVRLPGGRPVFPDVPRRSPEEVLADSGLIPGPRRPLDPARGASVVTWTRGGHQPD